MDRFEKIFLTTMLVVFSCMGILVLTLTVWLIGGMAGWWDIND